MAEKVAYVTGGNAGIGLASVLAFAERGCDVAIFSRRAEENDKAKAKVEALGRRCVTFAGDVTDEAFVASSIEQTAAELGRLDYAFNNAGVEEVPTPLHEQSSDEFRKIIDVNVFGVWVCMKYQIPKMLETGGGAIVNNGSVASLIGMAGVPVYVASKHAVLGLTRAAALEQAQQGVRINAVCPGAVRTDLYDRFIGGNAEMEKAIDAMHPMGRSGKPDEIASAVAWLCLDATWTTGQAMTVDGGFTAQ